MKRSYVQLNENGRRIGITHPRATIPEEVINEIRELHENEKIGYRRLSTIFKIRRSTIQKICKYYIRAQSTAFWKRVKA